MNFFMRTRGSVSVFLVIILVPILVVTFLFVDASRIELAKGLAASAGDLTLNTTLTNYDKQLNDAYGLLASSQDVEDFLGNANTYFINSMQSNGMSLVEAEENALMIWNWMESNDDVSDFLRVSLVDQDVNTIAPLADANLVNPQLLKAEIVEFMKYRAPINAVADFMSKLNKIESSVVDKPMEAELTKVKNNYYEKEGELLRKAFDVYLKLVDFNDLKITDSYMKEVSNYMFESVTKYKSLHTRLVKNWNNSQNDHGQNVFPMLSDVNLSPSASQRFDGKEALEYNIIRASNNLTSKLERYQKQKSNVNTIFEPLENMKPGDYDLQYWVQTAEHLYPKPIIAYKEAAIELFLANANYCHARDNRKEEEEEIEHYTEMEEQMIDGVLVMVEVKKQRTIMVKIPITQRLSDKIASGDGDSSETGTARSKFRTYKSYSISNQLHSISNQQLKNTNVVPANTELFALSNQLTIYRDYIKSGDKILEDTKPLLDELVVLAKAYDEAFVIWETEANNGVADNDMVIQDKAEIAAIKANERLEDEPTDETDTVGNDEHQVVSNNINENSVKVMIERLNNIRSLFGTYLKEIEGFEYGTEPIMNISNFNQLKHAAQLNNESIVKPNKPLKTYVTSTWKTLFKQVNNHEKGTVQDLHVISNKNSSEFNSKERKPDLYVYLFDIKFEGFTKEKLDEGQKIFDELDKLLKESDDDGNPSKDDGADVKSDMEIKGLQNLPSEGKSQESSGDTSVRDSKDKIDKSADGAEDAFGDITFDEANIFEMMRDNLYITEYIVSMFSHDTYERERKYQLSREGLTTNNPYKVKNSSGAVSEVNALNAKGVFSTHQDSWKKEETTFTYNKSLTNKMINIENNFTYGNEIEYILYGNTNVNNKAASYGTIYGMRFLMNLPPVMMEYYNKDIVQNASMAISMATSGIIPIPLVKMVICLGILAAESAVDVTYLKAGLPVLFIKDRRYLFIQIGGSAENVKDVTARIDSIKPNDNIGNSLPGKEEGIYFSYQDYLYLFLLIGTSFNGDNVYLRTADVIQCNMQKQLNNEKYYLENSVIYFEMKANLKVDPLLLGLPFARQEGAGILDSSSWNTFTYHGIRGY